MKKQIAVLMAAATAVTTVAPAIANADVNTHDSSVDGIVSEVKAKLNEKYKANDETGVSLPASNAVADVLNSRYAILVGGSNLNSTAINNAGFKKIAESDYKDYNFAFAVKDENDQVTLVGKENKDWYVVDDASKLANVLENSGENVQVAIIDKGAKDGLSYRTTGNKHYVIGNKTVADTDTTVSLGKVASDLFNIASKNKDSFVKKLKVTVRTGNDNTYTEKEYTIVDGNKAGSDSELSNDITKVELTLSGVSTPIVLEVGSDALDLEEARDENNNKLDVVGSANDSTVSDKVAKFEFIENDGDNNKSVKVDIPDGDSEVYTYTKYTEEKIELNNIYTKKDGYTNEGADLINSIVDAMNSKNGEKTFNFRGVSYIIDDTNFSDADKNGLKKPVIKAKDNGYELSFYMKVTNANDTEVHKTLRFVITGENQKDLSDVLSALKDKKNVVAGQFTRLMGSNRYATAIAVSQEQFNPGDASTVVIVGGYSQTDGLAAAPLAAAKNAPLLLADAKNGLSNETLAEIDRAAVTKKKDLKNKTVYIVGGEKSVPKSVEKQLEDKFGAVVVRVSGANRYDTSLSVAKRLNYDNNLKAATNGSSVDRVFVVGGEGAADAMSVSSVAAQVDITNGFVSPILVVNKNGISRDVREFVQNDLGMPKDAYLIGGTASLASQVFDDFKIAAKSVTRLSGENRYATNVEVVNTFFRNKNNTTDTGKTVADGVIVTSGDNKYLVDAQTSGAFAASIDAPILLTGNKLTGDQEDFFKKGKTDAKNGILRDVNHDNIYQVGGVVSSDVMSYIVDKLSL